MAHVHAELMKIYAEDAMDMDRPWKMWSFKQPDGRYWTECKQPPCFDPQLRYRRGQHKPELLI